MVAKISERFGRLIRDVMGNDSLVAASERTGASPTYVSRMRAGHVPKQKILGDFISGYGLDEEQSRRLIEAASETRQDIDLELMLAGICTAAGLSASLRLRVLDAFRAAVEAQKGDGAAIRAM